MESHSGAMAQLSALAPERWLAFVGVLLIVLCIPGPDFLVLFRHSLTGVRPGVRALAGHLTGLTLHTAAVTAGLSALIAAQPHLLGALRAAGAAYLAWLGFQALRSFLRPEPVGQAEDGNAEKAPAARRAGHPFRDGLLTNILNPKAFLFFLGLLPQFLTPGGSVAAQTLVLAATTILLALAWWTLVIYATRRGRRLLTRPPVPRALDGLTAAAFLGLAASLLW